MGAKKGFHFFCGEGIYWKNNGKNNIKHFSYLCAVK